MAVATPATSAVLSTETLLLRRSTGWTAGPTGKQQPQYAAAVSGQGSVQPVSQKDLDKVAAVYGNLNQQGDYKSVYLYGSWRGVVRAAQTGGDLLTRTDGSVWLVVVQAEEYPDWSRVIACRQLTT
jgi:hypothetical protein